jgi:hypothetical protein
MRREREGGLEARSRMLRAGRRLPQEMSYMPEFAVQTPLNKNFRGVEPERS